MSESKETIRLTTPLSRALVERCCAGDRVLLNGVIYTARDAAHARLAKCIEEGTSLPIPIEGQVIFFVGPTPAKPGWPIGAIGPTTASRMDRYSPALIALGLRGMIGKGTRSAEVLEAMKKYGCVYFGAVEGHAVLLARRVRSSQVVAYEDLGPEAIYRIVIEDFPVIVVNDVSGRDLYEEGRAKYARGGVTGRRVGE